MISFKRRLSSTEANKKFMNYSIQDFDSSSFSISNVGTDLIIIIDYVKY